MGEGFLGMTRDSKEWMGDSKEWTNPSWEWANPPWESASASSEWARDSWESARAAGESASPAWELSAGGRLPGCGGAEQPEPRDPVAPAELFDWQPLGFDQLEDHVRIMIHWP